MKITKMTALGMILAGAAMVAQGSMVLHYDFNEGSGAAVLDQSGNGLDGTIGGGAAYIAGTEGTALRLDGVDDFVALHTDTFQGMSNTVSLSVMAWGGPSNPDSTTFFWGAGSTNGSGRQIQIHLPWNNSTAYFRAPNTQPTANIADVQSGSWNHWVFTKDAGGTIQIVLNTDVIASSTDNGDLFSVAAGFIGMDASQNGNTGGRWYDGAVDDFRVYDHELSTGEIETLYAAIPEPATLGLLAVFGGGMLFMRRRFKR